MRVLLADANASFAELVESVLDGQPGITLVGWAIDAKQAVELALLRAPDIAFVAIDMLGGVEAAQEMLRVVLKPPKIILLGAEDPAGAVLAATADVSGYGAGLAATSGFSGYMAKTDDDAAEMIGVLAALAALTLTPPDRTNGTLH